MLYLMVAYHAYEGLLQILQHDLKKIGLQEYVFVGNLGKEELIYRWSYILFLRLMRFHLFSKLPLSMVIFPVAQQL